MVPVGDLVRVERTLDGIHQLAHAERNSVRAAYNYAEYLPERREMMQAWADYLDRLKNGVEIVPLRREV